MQICEGLLLSIILVLGIIVIVSDINSGIIRNKALLIAVVSGILVNIIYLAFFVRECIVIYLINWVAVSGVAILLYAYHFWAAGDSKLMIALAFLIPARYYENSVLLISGIYYIVFIFMIAYLYIIIESLILAYKKKRFFKERFDKKYLKLFLQRYLISYLYLRTISLLLQHIFGSFYNNNQLFFAFMNIFIVIFIHENPRFQKKWLVIAIGSGNAIGFIYNVLHRDTIVNSAILRNYGIVLLALFLRYLVSGYNYEEIATASVKKGMVLSYGTVATFMVSRVKGLPQSTNEDMSSRITEEEAEAIRRWENSKHGKATIIIVRKIPFAIFIVLGTLLFLIMRIVLICL